LDEGKVFEWVLDEFGWSVGERVSTGRGKSKLASDFTGGTRGGEEEVRKKLDAS